MLWRSVTFFLLYLHSIYLITLLFQAHSKTSLRFAPTMLCISLVIIAQLGAIYYLLIVTMIWYCKVNFHGINSQLVQCNFPSLLNKRRIRFYTKYFGYFLLENEQIASNVYHLQLILLFSSESIAIEDCYRSHHGTKEWDLPLY